MKTGQTVIALLCLSVTLCGCDVFYDARFTPVTDANAAFVAAAPVTIDTLSADFRRFAEKYGLVCTDNPGPGVAMHCYNGFQFLPEVVGGFDVESEGGHPLIHYSLAKPGGADFFSKSNYCGNLKAIKDRLEEFTGPLSMEASHTGGPPYDDCLGPKTK